MKKRPNRKILLALALSTIAIGCVFYFSSQNLAAVSAQKLLYTCPMHPSIISDHPDRCPICHMDLQKSGDDAKEVVTSEKPKERTIVFYRNPMNPQVTSPVPAKDEMGMDYVPIFSDEIKSEGSTPVLGRATFSLSAERQQMIGVTTAIATVRPLSREIRANGKVAFDPELFTAIEEYRQALNSRNEMKNNPYPALREQGAALASSSRTKLKLMGLDDTQIRRLTSAKVDPMALLLPKGQAWVYAEVYEYEISGVKEGQTVDVVVPSLPGETFQGKIASVSPVLNATTRTVRVRALVPDPKGILRPDTFANIKIQITFGEKLTVPSDSVLHSGDQDFVFVVDKSGKFEPRLVTVGMQGREFVEISQGLKSDETVVTAANFLIDSESRLRSVIQGVSKPVEKSQ